jgi:hypothetical protein
MTISTICNEQADILMISGVIPGVARQLARAAVITLLALMPSPALLAAPRPDSPGQMLRQLTAALLRADRAAAEALTKGDPEGIAALSGAEPAPERADRLEGDPTELEIKLLRPYEVEGRAVQTEEADSLPVGATALVAATLRGGQTQIWRVVHTPLGWKADLRWAARARAMAEQGEALETEGSPAWVARQLTLALLGLDHDRAAQLLLPGADPNLVFLGAPEQPDPSGHLQALALEMPLVVLAPGEAARMADGRVALGDDDPERRLLLGLFGVSELPFLLQRSGGSWRAQPQPWFSLMLR